jgi:hypothetical protein
MQTIDKSLLASFSVPRALCLGQNEIFLDHPDFCGGSLLPRANSVGSRERVAHFLLRL